MSEREAIDGTWTLKVVTRRGALWRALIQKSWIAEPRFRQARFVLAGGPTLLVSAEDLRCVTANYNLGNGTFRSLKLDPSNSSVNGEKVDMRVEA